MNKKLFKDLKSALEEVIAYKNITCKSDKMTHEERICSECGKDKPECAYYTYFTLEDGSWVSRRVCDECGTLDGYYIYEPPQETKKPVLLHALENIMFEYAEKDKE